MAVMVAWRSPTTMDSTERSPSHATQPRTRMQNAAQQRRPRVPPTRPSSDNSTSNSAPRTRAHTTHTANSDGNGATVCNGRQRDSVFVFLFFACFCSVFFCLTPLFFCSPLSFLFSPFFMIFFCLTPLLFLLLLFFSVQPFFMIFFCFTPVFLFFMLLSFCYFELLNEFIWCWYLVIM